MDHFSVPPQSGPLFSENTKRLKRTLIEAEQRGWMGKKPRVQASTTKPVILVGALVTFLVTQFSAWTVH